MKSKGLSKLRSIAYKVAIPVLLVTSLTASGLYMQSREEISIRLLKDYGRSLENNVQQAEEYDQLLENNVQQAEEYIQLLREHNKLQERHNKSIMDRTLEMKAHNETLEAYIRLKKRS